MSNNRMAIVCKECKKGLGIGKYYPSTGWYACNTDKIEKWLQEHRLNCYTAKDVMQGGEPFFLGYESDNKDWSF